MSDLREALRELRRFAFSRGLVVASPCRLVGSEVLASSIGDSDNLLQGIVSHKLISSDLLWDGLGLTKKEKALFEDIADILLEHASLDIEKFRLTESPGPQDDERARWILGKNLGEIVRVKEGEDKRYLMFLGDKGLWEGPPPFDIPLLGELSKIGRGRPVMVHEGPMAMDGALNRAWRADPSTGEGGARSDTLDGWLAEFDHVSWHGATAGISYTDWRPLKGRRVVLWPDMDAPGNLNMRLVAKRLTLMGNEVEMVNWEPSMVEENPGWDLADRCDTDELQMLDRSSVRARIIRLESPFDHRGFPHTGWMMNTRVDLERGEIYEAHRDYESLPFSSFNLMWGPKSIGKVIEHLSEYHGRTYLPGRPFGIMKDGRANVFRGGYREPCSPRMLPGATVKEVWRGWLKRMIPDLHERKHLIKRAAWSLVRRDKVPNHAVVMQGDSGIGKSAFMDLLIAVAGRREAVAIFPDSIFTSFNSTIENKSIVCLHELHSNDLNMRQNAQRLKELVSNKTITIRKKYQPENVVENIIHWFAATNESEPFAMENGSDRFYFVQCSTAKKGRLVRWLTANLPVLHEASSLVDLYAAAKALVLTMSPATCSLMVGRASPQKKWGEMVEMGRPAWAQEVYALMGELAEPSDGLIGGFFASDVFRAVRKYNPRLKRTMIYGELNRLGYISAKRTEGERHAYQIRLKRGAREVLWVASKDLTRLRQEGLGCVDVRRFTAEE